MHLYTVRKGDYSDTILNTDDFIFLMITRASEEFRTNTSLGQLLEEFFSSVLSSDKAGKQKVIDELSSLARFESKLGEDFNAIEACYRGLGIFVLKRIRQIPNLSYTELGRTLTYVRNTLPESWCNTRAINVEDSVDQIRAARNKHCFTGVEYCIFLEYVQLFKSRKPIDERIEEFNSVFSAVKDAFEKGKRVLAIMTKEVYCSWDYFLQNISKKDEKYDFAMRYKALEEKYKIRISKMEEIVWKYFEPNK